MRLGSGTVYATVALIVTLTFVSGPLVPVVDFTQARDGTATTGLGEGTISISAIDAPTSAALDQEFQSKTYYLRVPDATIRIERISGRPLVEYGIEIPAMGLSRSTTHFLSADQQGVTTLTLKRKVIEPGEVTKSRYEGILKIEVRYNDTERVVYNESIPVEVTG